MRLIIGLFVGLLVVAGCSSSSTPPARTTTSAPPAVTGGAVSSRAATTPAAAGPVKCGDLAGAVVPATFAAVDCDAGAGFSTVATNHYGCAAGGEFYSIAPDESNEFVGRPGGRWVKVSPDASLSDMASAVGCG